MIELRQLQRPDASSARARLAREELEALARHAVLVTERYAVRLGLGVEGAAATLGLARRTIAHWRARACRHAPPPRRGRPPKRLARDARRDVRAYLALLGPRTSQATLRGAFPDLAPSALAWERERFRDDVGRGRTAVIRALHWRRPGWVWALDFTQPPCCIEGEYGYILLARDLSSGMQLAALPVHAPTSRTVDDLLSTLFAAYGLPLVLKWDNGGAFRQTALQHHLRRRGVTLLYSPPAFPQYNGACEAGGGAIQTRAHHEAARHGRPGRWTCNDVAAARGQGNETARPWGPRGPTPAQRFRSRRMPSLAERRRFLARCADYEQAERDLRNLSEIAELDHYSQASIDRIAIARALTNEGVLSFRQRRISLPFNSHSRARIS